MLIVRNLSSRRSCRPGSRRVRSAKPRDALFPRRADGHERRDPQRDPAHRRRHGHGDVPSEPKSNKPGTPDVTTMHTAARRATHGDAGRAMRSHKHGMSVMI